MDYLRRLAPMTNIIPVIGQTDRLDASDISDLKSAVLEELQAAKIRPFIVGKSSPAQPFAISSATMSDADNMDASLLMSPDYVQPLQKSELGALVEHVFERETMAWLRHSAAKKFVHWWRARGSTNATSPMSMSGESFTFAEGSRSVSATVSRSMSPSSGAMSPMSANTSYALARVTDHTQREDRIAQVRLAKWASELQRSLQNERERYEAITRKERTAWLAERMEECKREEGSQALARRSGPVAGSRSWTWSGASSSHLTPQVARLGPNTEELPHPTKLGSVEVDARDPLGILAWRAQMKRQSWLALQVVGGVGLLGGLTLWLARRYWLGSLPWSSSSSSPSSASGWDWDCEWEWESLMESFAEWEGRVWRGRLGS